MKLLNYLNNSDDFNDEGKIISKVSIQRSDDFNTQYTKWLELNSHQSMLQDIYSASLSQRDTLDPAINFLMISKINGFTLQYDPKRWKEADFRYLFEYLAITLMQEHGFDKFSSMKEVTRYFDRVETVERYKLKNVDGEVDYSDILIRLCFINKKVSSLKFCATCTKKRITNFSGLLKKIAEA